MKLKIFIQLIRIDQTLFTLPFAYLGLLFAGGDEIYTWIWVTIALVSASTLGLLLNQLIDLNKDAKNPRKNRILISNREVKKPSVWSLAIFLSLILIFSAYMINRLCFHLSFVAILGLVIFPFIKRINIVSHFYLGIIQASSIIGGYLAVTSRFDIIPLLILSIAIFMWMSGLDIIYSLKDVEFDKDKGPIPISARYGMGKASMISSILYVFAMIALIIAGVLTSRGTAYWVSIISVAIIFYKQQFLIRNRDFEIAIVEFIQINHMIPAILFIGTFIDVMIK
ncbi:MAG: UbiA-like polyprenyltransferase [Spirochaetota bacterium]|nr:UbiA-like polyprenyltransferase [Spirochaetota bacterium]